MLPLSALANFILVFLIQGNPDYKGFNIKQNRTHIFIIIEKSETYNYKYREGIKIENERGLVQLPGYKLN